LSIIALLTSGVGKKYHSRARSGLFLRYEWAQMLGQLCERGIDPAGKGERRKAAGRILSFAAGGRCRRIPDREAAGSL